MRGGAGVQSQRVLKYYCEPCELWYLDNFALSAARVFCAVEDKEDLSLAPPKKLFTYHFADSKIIRPFLCLKGTTLSGLANTISGDLEADVYAKEPRVFTHEMVRLVALAWSEQLNLRLLCKDPACHSGTTPLEACDWCRLSVHSGLPMCKSCPVRVLAGNPQAEDHFRLIADGTNLSFKLKNCVNTFT